MRMKKLGLLAAAAALALTACGPGKKPQAEAQYNVDLPVKEVMGHVIDPAAQTFWRYSGEVDTAQGTTSRVPKPDDEEAWENAMTGAVGLIEGANVLMLPGRARDNGDWIKFAKQLQAQGFLARASVEAKDGQKMFDVGGTAYEVCLACHEKYLLPFLDPKTGEPLPGSPLDSNKKPEGLDEQGRPIIKANNAPAG
jgi:hypothetical protein